MSLINNTKEIVKIVQQIDNLELYKKILDLQSEINDLVQKNREHEEDIRELSEKLKYHGSLNFKDNALWKEGIIDAEHGPFCSGCWDSEKKLVRLISLECEEYTCSVCKTDFRITSLLKSGQKEDGFNSLSEEENKILIFIASLGEEDCDIDQIANCINQNQTRANYFLDKLVENKLIYLQGTFDGPVIYFIDQGGRSYLVENHMI